VATFSASQSTGDKKDLEARCEQIRQAMENTTSDYDREKLQERLAKLSGEARRSLGFCCVTQPIKGWQERLAKLSGEAGRLLTYRLPVGLCALALAGEAG
jgi:hypothetical protein